MPILYPETAKIVSIRAKQAKYSAKVKKLSVDIIDSFARQGITIDIHNFSAFTDLIRSACGSEVCQAVYNEVLARNV